MHVDKLHDYLRANAMKTLSGAQVATENLSQDFPTIFPAFSWLISCFFVTFYIRTH
jgi:hypothetical protein